ncbi:tetratricopeptide repeat protein [Streptomyces sp. SKN60]|uniref:ATP-binding protein n=1 Tax=Streptomyces sp. SKN60 TaxID=2855506 RepID=UPI002246FC06|nr:tetratricopeptide repeat protein [Streptomyces sp. SKN60]MCX2185176.1 tetratricopeptide repeat protein [Streptomyces sp. SKN60]
MAIGGDAHGPILVNSPQFIVVPGSTPESSSRPKLLPPDVQDFTGREDDVDRAVEAVRANFSSPGTMVAVISGQPGIGKTSFALRIAHMIEQEFTGGVLYADLRGVDPVPAPPDEIARRFLHVLGVPDGEIPADPYLRLDLYRHRTAGRGLLVVLDNAADERQVRPLLPSGPGTAVLVTSRNRLAGLESTHRFDLAVFSTRTSFDFLERVTGRTLAGAEAQAAIEVAEHCDHLPLALRIAAYRVQSSPRIRMADLAVELHDEHERLDALSVGDLAVRKAFNLSYRKLGKASRNTFKKVAHVPTSEFGPGICGALTGSGEAQARKALRKLAEANLVEPSAVAGRYRIHDLLKEFVREKALKGSPTESAADVRRMILWLQNSALRAQNHIVGVLEVEVPTSTGAAVGSFEEAVTWVEQEIANAVGALVMSEALGRPKDTATFALSLNLVCQTVGRWDEWATVCATGLRASTAAEEPELRVTFLTETANLARYRRDFATALTHASQAHDESRATKAVALITGTASLMGCLLMDLGRRNEALPLLHESLELAERFNMKHEVGKALYNLGTIHRDSGELRTALPYFERDLAVCRETSDEAGAAETMNTMGITYAELGEPQTAEKLQRDALSIFSRLRNPHKISMVLNDLALTFRRQGRFEEALSLHAEDIELCRSSGNTSGEGVAHGNAAEILYRLGRIDEAVERAALARDRFVELGDRQRFAQTVVSQISVLFHGGPHAESIAVVNQALQILAEFDEAKTIALAHFALAREYREKSLWEETFTHAVLALSDDGKVLPPVTRIATCVLALEAAAQLHRWDAVRQYERLLGGIQVENPDISVPDHWVERARSATGAMAASGE